jgi:hypothetical protein
VVAIIVTGHVSAAAGIVGRRTHASRNSAIGRLRGIFRARAIAWRDGGVSAIGPPQITAVLIIVVAARPRLTCAAIAAPVPAPTIAPTAAPRPPPTTPPMIAPAVPPTMAPPSGSCAAAGSNGAHTANASSPASTNFGNSLVLPGSCVSWFRQHDQSRAYVDAFKHTAASVLIDSVKPQYNGPRGVSSPWRSPHPPASSGRCRTWCRPSTDGRGPFSRPGRFPRRRLRLAVRAPR